MVAGGREVDSYEDSSFRGNLKDGQVTMPQSDHVSSSGIIMKGSTFRSGGAAYLRRLRRCARREEISLRDSQEIEDPPPLLRQYGHIK